MVMQKFWRLAPLTWLAFVGGLGASLWFTYPIAAWKEAQHIALGRVLGALFVTLATDALAWVAAVLVALAALRAGTLLQRVLGAMPWALRSLAGCVGLALATFALGCLGLAHDWLLGSALGALAIWQVLTWRGIKPPRLSCGNVVLALVLLGLSLPLLIALLHPTVFYDALVYHLSLTQRYISQHNIHPLPWNLYSHFPSLGEMLFIDAWSMGGQIAAQLMQLLFLLLGVAAFAGCAQQVDGGRASWLPWFVAVFVAALPLNALTCGIDLLVFAFGAATLFFVLRVANNEDAAASARAAMFFAAACAATKSPNLAYALVPTALLLVWAWRQGTLSRRQLLEAAAVGLCITAPGWLRAFAATGNPLYPLPLTGPSMDDAAYAALQVDAHAVHASQLLPWDIARVFWDMTFNKLGTLEDRFGVGSLVGIVPLCCLASINLWREKRAARWVAVFALCSMLLWVATFHMTRFALVGLGAAMVLGLTACRQVFDASRVGRGVVVVVLGVHGVLHYSATVYACMHNTAGFAMLAHGLDREAYLLLRARDRPQEMASYPLLYKLAQAIDGNVDTAHQDVLTVGEPASLYIPGTPIATAGPDENPLLGILQNTDDPRAVGAFLHDLGVGYVLYRANELGRLGQHFARTPDTRVMERLETFLQGQRLVATAEGASLYALDGEAP